MSNTTRNKAGSANDSDVKMQRAKELLRQRELRFKDRVDGAAAGAKNKQTKAKSYEIGENSNLQLSSSKTTISKVTDKDLKWYRSLIEKGTLKDKLTAFGLIVKTDPSSALGYVISLLKMAGKKDRKQAFIAIDTLQEVFTLNLLPKDRKLKSFKALLDEAAQEKKKVNDPILCDMYYEHKLRSLYIEYIELVGKCTNDPLDYFKKLAISVLSDCLMACPEQEETLLTLLVNKLGDPNDEVAKHTIQNLVRILKTHGNMTQVVTGEVRQQIERVKTQSIYHYISLLNKIVFFEDDIEFIASVVKLYFSQFKRLNKEKEEKHKNNILTLILRGINNIVNNLDPGTLESTFKNVSEEIDALFKLTHSNSFNVQVESMKLIFHFIKVEETLRDRYYRTLYNFISELTNVSALKLDSTFALFYKSIKQDSCIERVQAFFKRIIQSSYQNEISFVAASLLLINEVMKHRKELRGLIFSKGQLLDSDDEEKFVDVDDGEPKTKKSKKKKKKREEKAAKKKEESESEDEAKHFNTNDYNPNKKEPKFANADKVPFWDLNILRNYYHPTIRIWANNLISGKQIDYSGDPLQDFSMGNFLDKIILKPAKSSEKLNKMRFKKNRNARADEIRQIVSQQAEKEILEESKTGSKAKSSSITQKNSDIRPDEEFLYKHLLLKSKSEKQKRQKELDAKSKKRQKQDEEADIDDDPLGKEVEDFEMSEGELGEEFFGDEEGLEDVDVQSEEYDKDVFQEAPSESDE